MYALLADPTLIPRWRPDVLEASALDPRGNRYSEVIAFMGRKFQTFEVVEREPGRRWVVRAVDGLSLRPTQAFTLTPAAGGTRFEYAIDLPVTGLFVLMKPLLSRMIPAKWQSYSSTLKRLAEEG